jgi:hypothetical protein
LNEVAVARFLLGFCHLWRWEADKAAEQIEAALSVSERIGDVTHRARCLTYLTIASRQRGRVAEARDYVSRSRVAAAEAQMPEYIGTAEANAAWVAWREGNLADTQLHGHAALETWGRLPAGHASCSFQWTALWPLIGVALMEDRVSEVADLVGRLLAPEQQPPPDQISTILGQAILAERGGKIEEAHVHLQRAAESAQKRHRRCLGAGMCTSSKGLLLPGATAVTEIVTHPSRQAAIGRNIARRLLRAREGATR